MGREPELVVDCLQQDGPVTRTPLGGVAPGGEGLGEQRREQHCLHRLFGQGCAFSVIGTVHIH